MSIIIDTFNYQTKFDYPNDTLNTQKNIIMIACFGILFMGNGYNLLTINFIY